MQMTTQIQQSLGSEAEYEDYENFLYQEFLENEAEATERRQPFRMVQAPAQAIKEINMAKATGYWETDQRQIMVFPNSRLECVDHMELKVPSTRNDIWFVRARRDWAGVCEQGICITEFTIIDEPLVGTLARYYAGPIETKNTEGFIIKVMDAQAKDGIWLCKGVYWRN